MLDQRLIKSPHSSCICTFYHNGKANVMVVDCVETEEEHRNQGYAAELIKQALDIAVRNGADAVELVVNRDNSAAKHLYEKAGFKKTDKEHYRIILNEWTT